MNLKDRQLNQKVQNLLVGEDKDELEKIIEKNKILSTNLIAFKKKYIN